MAGFSQTGLSDEGEFKDWSRPCFQKTVLHLHLWFYRFECISLHIVKSKRTLTAPYWSVMWNSRLCFLKEYRSVHSARVLYYIHLLFNLIYEFGERTNNKRVFIEKWVVVCFWKVENEYGKLVASFPSEILLFTQNTMGAFWIYH